MSGSALSGGTYTPFDTTGTIDDLDYLIWGLNVVRGDYII